MDSINHLVIQYENTMYSLKCKECILYFLLNNFSLEFRDVLFLFFLTLWLCRLIYMVSKWLKYREQKKTSWWRRRRRNKEKQINCDIVPVFVCVPFCFWQTLVVDKTPASLFSYAKCKKRSFVIQYENTLFFCFSVFTIVSVLFD